MFCYLQVFALLSTSFLGVFVPSLKAGEEDKHSASA